MGSSALSALGASLHTAKCAAMKARKSPMGTASVSNVMALPLVMMDMMKMSATTGVAPRISKSSVDLQLDILV